MRASPRRGGTARRPRLTTSVYAVMTTMTVMSTKPRSSAGEKVVDVRTTELTADVSCSDVLRSVVRTGPTRWSPAMNSAPTEMTPAVVA